MRKLRWRPGTALLSFLCLISSNSAIAQCSNPVGLDHILANLDIGFSVDPADPQPDIVLATQGVPVRGFIHPEGGDVGSVQCDSDHILTYTWIGAHGATAEDRLQSLIDFRALFTQVDFFIDGVAVFPAEVIETAPRDGFNPSFGIPVAYLFVGWVIEPGSLVPGPHQSRADFGTGDPQFAFSFETNFEVISGDPDGDGIAGGIDGTLVGVFNDQSDEFSSDFTDQHLSGTTHGGIVARNGNIVMVDDQEDPLRGVVLSATGGVVTSHVRVCGVAAFDSFNIFLTDGDRIRITCGSLSGEVLTGPVTVTVGENFEVTLPAGAIAFMDVLPGPILSVRNDSGAGGPDIVIDDNGVATHLGPAEPPFMGILEVLPDAPDDLIARAKRTKVNLLWTPVEADSYDIYRAGQSGGPYDLIGSVARNVFLDTGLIAGETYFYVVQAVTDVGPSENSNEVEVQVRGRRSRR